MFNPPQLLYYGQQVYLYTPTQHYLFGRGFINKEIYLTVQSEKCSECVFIFKPKTNKNNNIGNNISHVHSNPNSHQQTNSISNSVIIYGTQLIIKHRFSAHYLSIKIIESTSFVYVYVDQPQLVLSQEEDESCYFQLTPQRNFQQNGQPVTVNSFFAIQSSYFLSKNLCISSLQRNSDYDYEHEQIPKLHFDNSFPYKNMTSKNLRSPRTSQRRQSSAAADTRNRNVTEHCLKVKDEQNIPNRKRTLSNRRSNLINNSDLYNNQYGMINQERIQLEDKQSQQSVDYRYMLDQSQSNDNQGARQSSMKYCVKDAVPVGRDSSNDFEDSTLLKNPIQTKMSFGPFKQEHLQISKVDSYEQIGQSADISQKMENKQAYVDDYSMMSALHSADSFPFEELKMYNNEPRAYQLAKCNVQAQEYSFWKVQLKNTLQTQYLTDNDYIQFIYSSKSNGILSINLKNYPFQVQYKPNRGQEQELLSSFFRVQIVEQVQVDQKGSQSVLKNMYLKHILTDQYFPLNENNQKSKFILRPVCHPDSNQLPVFEILFDEKIYQPWKSDITTLPKNYKVDAFWINKVDPLSINEIMSFQGVSERVWIPYFKEYLNKTGKKGQKILCEVQLLRYMIEKVLPRLKQKNTTQSTQLRKQCFQLLFKACLQNPSIKRYLIKSHIKQILQQQQKQFINDLMIQLLQNGQSMFEQYITANVIGQVINQFQSFYKNQLKSPWYSISYLRLFRIFCGSDQQPCQRNQRIIFEYFFTSVADKEKGSPPPEMIKKMDLVEQTNTIKSSNLHQNSICQSYVNLLKNKDIKIDQEYKFEIIQKQNEIYFVCNKTYKTIDQLVTTDIDNQQQSYLRQYLYLLSDTMKNQNNTTIKRFTKKYPLKLLLDILTHPNPQYNFLKGPIMSLILTSYLSKQTKYQFYIFYQSYPKLCYMGRITAQKFSQQNTRILQFIKMQITTSYQKSTLEKRHFYSTTFKHFLSLIKISIQIGLWNNQNQLHQIVSWLQKIFEFDDVDQRQNSKTTIYHQSYSEKLQQRNLMKSKTLAVEIYILYVDLQINMCISQLLNDKCSVVRGSNTSIVQKKINEFYQKSCNWNLNKLIFKICSTSNSQLMKKSLFLFKKLYNIKEIVQDQFVQASQQIKEENENENLKEKIKFSAKNKYQLKINSQQQCQRYIAACFDKQKQKEKQKDKDKEKQKGMFSSFISSKSQDNTPTPTPSTNQRISLSSIKKSLKKDQNNLLQNIYRYSKPNHQFQNLAFKLGIHTKIIQNLTAYLNLRKQQKSQQKKTVLSYQLFLLLALIKGNLHLKQSISEYRSLFITLLNDQQQLYYVACDILIHVYKENRKLVVSDTENLQKICIEISLSLRKGTHVKKKIDQIQRTKKSQEKIRAKSPLSHSATMTNVNNNNKPMLSPTSKLNSSQNSVTGGAVAGSGAPQKQKATPTPNNNITPTPTPTPIPNQFITSKPTPNPFPFPIQKTTRSKQTDQYQYSVESSRSINLKDCKLLSLLLVFIKIQNKRLQKNQKIILRNTFNKENLILLQQKIQCYDKEDNLINIFKILVYHLLKSLGKHPQSCFNGKLNGKLNGNKQSHNSNIFNQSPLKVSRRNSAINILSSISQGSLNNLVLSIGRSNWDIKSIVFKFLEEKVQTFSKENLIYLMRLVYADLNIFCEMQLKDQIYQCSNSNVDGNGLLVEHQQQQQSLQFLKHYSNISEESSSSGKNPTTTKINFTKNFRIQVQAFQQCCPYIIKCIQNIILTLMTTSSTSQFKSFSNTNNQLFNLLVINVERLFLLRNIFPSSIIQRIQNIPSLLIKEKQMNPIMNQNKNIKNIDFDMLYKLQKHDLAVQQLNSNQSKKTPLIVSKAEVQSISNRDKLFLQKKNSELDTLSTDPLVLFQRIISSHVKQASSSKAMIFPTQKQVLKEFIINLIKVNSSDSSVLSDELKTFFLKYLSHSYLQCGGERQQGQQHLEAGVNNASNLNNYVGGRKLLADDSHHNLDNNITGMQSIEKKQNLLIEYQIPLVICTILCEGFRNRYSLFSNMFQLANRLLDGGNTKGQNKFMQAFKDDQKNQIFQNIYNLINQLLQTIKFYYTNQNILISEMRACQQTTYQIIQTNEQCKIVCKLLCEVFRFLQLLCENNNREMKNYIFSQCDQNNRIKYLSVNFVNQGINVFHEMFEIIESNVMSLKKKFNAIFAKQVQQNLFQIPNSILDFFIEVCQIPALQNQVFLCKTNFFQSISKLEKLSSQNEKFMKSKTDLLTNSRTTSQQRIKQARALENLFFPKQSTENILFVYQRKFIILFRSLLEQENTEIIDIMSKKLQSKQFQYFINEALFHGGLQDTQKLKVLLTQPKLNHYLQTIVDVLIVKKILMNNEQLSFAKTKQDIISSLQSRIQSININFQSQNLTVYFPFHPLFQLLTQRTQKFFIDRSIGFKSRNEKLRDFIISRNVIYQDIENQKNAADKLMNDRSMSNLFFLSILLAYLVIALLVVFYSVSKSGTVLDVIQVQIISGISLMQVIITTIYTVIWGINISPITRQKLKTKRITSNGMPSQGVINMRQLPKNEKKINIWSVIIPPNIKEQVLFIKQIYIVQPASFHAVLLFLVSLGAFLFEPRLYSFTLIFFFARIQLLESILKAIRLTWKQLLIVCLLSVVFSFIFGFLTINNYIIPLYQSQEIDIDINRINAHCNSISSCINSLYTQKIIGESVNQNGDQNQFLSDLTYWGFFEILLTNIIAAIIIDKFAEQRNAKEKIQNQRHNRCYVCSADKSTLQRKGIDFGQHVNKTHFLWNYFYYMYSLQRLKKSTQFTGIEYWIQHQVKNTKIDWIPLDQSKRDDFTDQKISYIYSWIKKNQKNSSSLGSLGLGSGSGLGSNANTITNNPNSNSFSFNDFKKQKENNHHLQINNISSSFNKKTSTEQNIMKSKNKKLEMVGRTTTSMLSLDSKTSVTESFPMIGQRQKSKKNKNKYEELSQSDSN